jgi:uracil phosphoribosyltransferase
MIYRLNDHPSAAHTVLNQLRDAQIQQDRWRFRMNLERLGQFLGYELSKALKYELIKIETPLGIAVSREQKHDLVLATILRAGLPVHQGLLSVFDNAESAFISAYRKHHKDGTFEIEMQYTSCPPLKNKVLILSDAMLATGSSMEKALNALLQHGKPSQIHIVAGIAANYGVNHMRRIYPSAHLWIGAEDEELTGKYYIVPGLGDAGDLAYGEKIQD